MRQFFQLGNDEVADFFCIFSCRIDAVVVEVNLVIAEIADGPVNAKFLNFSATFLLMSAVLLDKVFTSILCFAKKAGT